MHLVTTSQPPVRHGVKSLYEKNIIESNGERKFIGINMELEKMVVVILRVNFLI